MSSTKADPSTSILVADSSPVTQKSIMSYLTDFHFKDITVIKDGYELLSISNEKKFDLIILDHHLNKSNSLNSLSDIQGKSENNDTPIVFMFN